MSSKGPYSLFCGNCGSRKSSTHDPHSVCRKCKPLCSSDKRCDQCRPLSDKDFSNYVGAVKKSVSEERRKAAKQTSGGGDESVASTAVTSASDTDTLVVMEDADEFDEESSVSVKQSARTSILQPQGSHKRFKASPIRPPGQGTSRSRSPLQKSKSATATRGGASSSSRSPDRRRAEARKKRFSKKRDSPSQRPQEDQPLSGDQQATVNTSMLEAFRSMVSEMLDARLGPHSSASSVPPASAAADSDPPASQPPPSTPTTPRSCLRVTMAGDASTRHVVEASSSDEEFVSVSNPPLIPILPTGDGDGSDEPEEQGDSSLPSLGDRLSAVADFLDVDLVEVQAAPSAAKKARFETFSGPPQSASPRRILPAHRMLQAAADEFSGGITGSTPGRLLPPLVLSERQRVNLPVNSPIPLTPPPLDVAIPSLASAQVPHKATDAQLVHLDKEARTILGLSNYTAHACEAMAGFAKEAGMASHEAAPLFHAFSAVASGVAQTMLAAARLSAGITCLRRDGFLSRAQLPGDLRGKLRETPPSAEALFGNAIEEVMALRQERQQRELTDQAIRKKTPKKSSGGKWDKASTPKKVRTGGLDFRGGGRGRRSAPQSPATPGKRRPRTPSKKKSGKSK